LVIKQMTMLAKQLDSEVGSLSKFGGSAANVSSPIPCVAR
jgi:hypothetical protein